MTIQQMYKLLERLYAETDWSSKASIHHYNEMARLYRQMVAEQQEEDEHDGI